MNPPRQPLSVGRRGGLYILSLGVHGLIRSRQLELGRDEDTGGQTTYMVEQARALGANSEIESVELITRRIYDRRVDSDYSVPVEPIASGARIVRIPFGPRRYLRKESLWPYLDSLVDNLSRYVRSVRRAPDIIHGHYADAGYVGNELARMLGVPFVFTGHSLGRIKLARLLETGLDSETLEQRYRLRSRIEAEERALETASLVIASTHQEVVEQYQQYDHYQPERMEVIPPGVDLSRFSPPTEDWSESAIRKKLEPFLRDPEKTTVLAIARPDERKNFPTLIRAYGETPGLRQMANLILVTGPRSDIEELNPGSRRVLQEILRLIDRYNLYGSVAYPKEVSQEGIADLYRFAAKRRGVFVNPALTEPFGLTLIEAAASGLPIIATADGGPQDIIQVCRNGELVDPLDGAKMGERIFSALKSSETWNRWSESGLAHVGHFSWANHAERYASVVQQVLDRKASRPRRLKGANRLPRIDRFVVTDLDGTLTGDQSALERFVQLLGEAGDRVGLIIVTGRSLGTARPVLEALPLPAPEIIVTGSGTEIHYGWPTPTPDESWLKHIDFQWDPDAVRQSLRGLQGVNLLPHEGRLRVACRVDPDVAPSVAEIKKYLRQQGRRVNVVLDRRVHLDILPMRASPGLALRFLSFKLDLPLERMLAAGDSGNDLGMLSGNTLGVVVGNHTPALEVLRERPRVYFSHACHAAGIIEGIDYYNFFGKIRIPQQELAE
jgi:sucrose-phosphate synthase